MTWGDRPPPAGTGFQPAPMNAPRAVPLGVGIQPGTPNIIRARQVIISGSGDFLLMYNGTPGPTTLLASLAAQAGADSFGTAYPAGFAMYDTAGKVRLEMGTGANPFFQLQNTFGALVGLLSNRLDALLWYADTGSATQGAIQASIAGKAGTDSFGNAFPQGVKIFNGVFEGTDYEINSSGAFFYSAAPALGNLILSIAKAGGTDASGNAYLAGLANYTNIGGTFYAVVTNAGEVAYYTAASEAGPWTLHVVEHFNPASGFLGLGPAGAPLLEVGDNVIATTVRTNGVNLQIGLGGVIVAEPPGSPGTAESWHPMTLAAGWSNVAGSPPAAYRLNAFGNVELTGRVTGTISGATQIGTLPTGYYSTTYTRAYAANVDSASAGLVASETPHIFSNTAGNVGVTGINNGSATVDLDGTFMLSNG